MSLDSPKFCLRWHSFADNVLESFETLYGNNSFTDVTLACKGETIKAHQLVLSASSLYLKKLLLENPCPHPVIIFNDIEFQDLSDIIQFMYRGEIEVESRRIAQLLHTGHMLDVCGFTDMTLPQPDVTCFNGISSEVCSSIPTDNNHVSNENVNETHNTANDDQLPLVHPYCPLLNQALKRPVPSLQTVGLPHNLMDGVTVYEPTNTKHNTIQDTAMLENLSYVQHNVKEEPIDTSESTTEHHNLQEFNNDSTHVNYIENQLSDIQSVVSVVPATSETDIAMKYRKTITMNACRDVTSKVVTKLAFHEPRPCSICLLIYRDAATLRTHMNIMHSVTSPPVDCTKCNAKFNTKYDLQTHRKTSHNY